MTALLETPVRTAPTWAVDPAHSNISFAVTHLAVATVRGEFPRFSVALDLDEAEPERSGVEVRIDASSVDTRNPERDQHLRSADFLDVERYPDITFVSRSVESLGRRQYRVVGDLTLRGVTREVALAAGFGGVSWTPWGTEVFGFSATCRINREEFGLRWNRALETGGFLVGNVVRLSVEVEAIRQYPGACQG